MNTDLQPDENLQECSAEEKLHDTVAVRAQGRAHSYFSVRRSTINFSGTRYVFPN
jgi:hypothetical protein